MDYKEKYENGVECIQEILSGGADSIRISTLRKRLQPFFPELQENNGETIKKVLIDYFNEYKEQVEGCGIYTFNGMQTDDILAWLEKQGESDEIKTKMFLINKGYPIDTNGIFPTYEEMYNIIRDGLENQNPTWSEKDKNLLNRLIGVLDGTNEEDYHEGWEEKFLPWLKSLKDIVQIQPKQECSEEDERIRKALIEFFGEQCDMSDWNGVYGYQVFTWLEKQGEKKHADKVEPKFKIRDFIVNDYCKGKVIEITNDAYLLDTGQGIPFSCEHNAHLWTIQDAEDGDVLVEDSCIFIIQKLCDNSTAAKTYCTLHIDGDFDDGSILYFDIDSTKPATQEQRDLLFQAMKEAGYEWDSKKKELKKI